MIGCRWRLHADERFLDGNAAMLRRWPPLLAPVFRRDAESEKANDDDRRPMTFRAAYVFDASQTDPLPSVPEVDAKH